jgi:protein TonB
MTLPAGHRAAAPDTYQRILDSIAPNAGRLKESYNGHLARALAVAVGVHLLGVGAYWLVATSGPPVVIADDDGVIDVIDYQLPPPPITPPSTPPGQEQPPILPTPRTGIITPTPDVEADPDDVAPTQEQLANQGDGDAEAVPGSGGGNDGPVGPGLRPTETPAEEVEDPQPAPQPREEPVRTDEVLPFSEVQPALIGGIEGLQSKIEYPSFDRSARNEGRVIVAFVVDENGVPSQITVARSVTPGLDAAAVAAVREARFTPGRQNGRNVKVRFTLPVTFRLR